jgi:hypothetical protein
VEAKGRPVHSHVNWPPGVRDFRPSIFALLEVTVKKYLKPKFLDTEACEIVPKIQ